MNVDYKLIGNRIKSKRKTMTMTQEILAEKLDVSIGYVSQVERGITKISLDLLAEISAILNCDIAELITESSIESNTYMLSELMHEIDSLSNKKRKLLLEIIKLLSDC